LTEDIDVDAATGIVTLTNNPVKISYNFNIIVTNTGGTTNLDSGFDVNHVYNPTLVIEGFSVTTVCGPLSSTLTRPHLITYLHVSELSDCAMQTASFENSNEQCPITEIVIDNPAFLI